MSYYFLLTMQRYGDYEPRARKICIIVIFCSDSDIKMRQIERTASQFVALPLFLPPHLLQVSHSLNFLELKKLKELKPLVFFLEYSLYYLLLISSSPHLLISSSPYFLISSQIPRKHSSVVSGRHTYSILYSSLESAHIGEAGILGNRSDAIVRVFS